MEAWMVRRGYVALADYRRARGGAGGRRDQQAVEEIVQRPAQPRGARNQEINRMLLKIPTQKTVTSAAAANHFGVMQVHNLQETIVKQGVAFDHEGLIFEVCQPQQAKKVLEENMSVSTALPCRISIYKEGGKTMLATLKPTVMLEMLHPPRLKGVAQEVEATIV
jgi:uncharacterized protein (DUF302 family)